MGTGKTPATLVYLKMVAEDLLSAGDSRGKKPVLVITPATVKWNWYAENATWLPERKFIDSLVIEGTPSERKERFEYMELMNPEIVIINYELVRMHQQYFQNLGDEDDPFFLAIVCDEVQRIKWVTSQTTQAVRSIMAHFHVALTGTPISNKPDSVHGILEWLENTRPIMRWTKATPPRPNNNCPLDQWTKKRHKSSKVGCRACQYWQDEDCKHPQRHYKPYKNPKERKLMRRRSTGQWGTLDQFRTRYCKTETVHTRRGDFTKVVGAKKHMMPELYRRMKEFGAERWRLNEVLSLEPIIYEHIKLEPTPHQAQLIRQIESGIIRLAEGGMTSTKRIALLAQLTYLRMATTLTPRAFKAKLNGKDPEFTESLKIGDSDDGAKQEWLVEMLASQVEDTGNKFLIFSTFTSALRPLLKRLQRVGLDELVWHRGELKPAGRVKNPKGYCAIIDGQVDQRARQVISDRWNNDPTFKVFLGSPAAFEGINMQGGVDEEDHVYVVALNMPWVPTAVTQFIGRAHRHGQEGQVVVLFPSLRNTIDQKMAERLLEKQDDIDRAVDGGQVDVARLFDIKTTQDVLDLVGGKK